MSQTPSIGRIVHYHSYGTPGGEYLPEPRAAVVTAVKLAEVEGGLHQASLCILNPTGMFFAQDVYYHPDPTPGCWTWPPRA